MLSRSTLLNSLFIASMLLSTTAPALPLPGDATIDKNLVPTLPEFVRIQNLTGSPDEVILDLDTGPVSGAVQPGFRLLDRSLTATFSNLGKGKGEIRARFGIRIDRRRLKRLGIRIPELRLMQFDARKRRWVRASRLLLRDRVGVRFLRASPTFKLGDFGVDPQNNLVWGVTDRGGMFAVAARLAQAPAPSSALLAGLGISALAGGALLRRRRRRLTA